jgi:preprotein translocase subunit SecE
MAKGKGDKQAPEVAEEEPEAPASSPTPEDRDELALAGGEPGGEGDALATAGRADLEEAALEGEEEVSAAQLGTERYVMAGFFAAAMLGAYVLGKVVHGVWATISNQDWFSQTLPRLAAVADDDKATYSLVLGGIASVILIVRTYRKPEVRTWSEDVAAELTKVKWPTKKEVYNSTFVVIAASAVATIYLALLDRLWGFITNLVYGDGS